MCSAVGTSDVFLQPGPRSEACMNRVPAVAVLLAAFLPSLEAQMRAMQHPGVATRMSVGSRFRALQLPPVSAGVVSPRPVGGRASLVRSVAFRHNVRFYTVVQSVRQYPGDLVEDAACL